MSGKRAVDYDFSFKNKDSFFSQFKNTCEYYHSEKTAEKISNNEQIKYNKEFLFNKIVSAKFMSYEKDLFKVFKKKEFKV